jgi:hypothetical protein
MQWINTTNQFEAVNSMIELIKRMNDYLSTLTKFIRILLNSTNNTRVALIKYFLCAANLNLERNKMFINNFAVSTVGFLICFAYVLLNIFFTNENGKKIDNMEVIFNEINLNFCLSNKIIDFTRFDRISIADMKEFLEKNLELFNQSEYNFRTLLFYIIHILLHFSLRFVDEEYVKVLQLIHFFNNSGNINDPKLYLKIII